MPLGRMWDTRTQRYWATGRGCMNSACAVSYSATESNKQLRAIALSSAAATLRPEDFGTAHLVLEPHPV